MKVVLFCGGMGMRLREYSESIPKPMVEIGYRPIMWHVMKYYAHYGHKDFVLCLGYKADVVKKYFVNYDECISNDFVLSNGCKDVKLMSSDISDWKITFVDTGLRSNVGERLKAVEKHVGEEDVFLANYSDGLTDLHFPDYLKMFLASNKVAAFVSVKPTQSFHVVRFRNGHDVSGITHIGDSDIWINGGYFIFRKEIFQYMKAGEELVVEPFRRLIEDRQIITLKHNGFWVAMDTFKDKQYLDDLVSTGNAPWEVWKADRAGTGEKGMLNIGLAQREKGSLNILCLGAHSDDIEIGCGGTILQLQKRTGNLVFYWVVFSANEKRKKEAHASAREFLTGAKKNTVITKNFRDGYFPYFGADIKDYFEKLKKAFSPDLILTHARHDLHQDHRLISDLTWNTFRDHMIMEYEIAKYDGDLGSPNLFVHIDEDVCRKKVSLIRTMFGTQARNHWFSEEIFQSLLRLRGIESNAPTGYAEAYYSRKAVLG